MGAYDNDPRVVKNFDTEYRVYPNRMTVRKENDVWNAYNQDGSPSRIVAGLRTLDGAIRAIIGDPQ